MVAAISKKVNQSLGQGATSPARATLGNSNLVELDSAGIANIIGRAELAAIAAAITHDQIHTATYSLTSLHQIRKQLLYPEKPKLGFRVRVGVRV